MFTANVLPGQGFQQFTVHKCIGGINSKGRTMVEKPTPTDIAFYGMLMNASQKEIDQWKQNGHPITHKIIEYSAMQKASATDYLVTEDGRQFYVQGTKNPANLNVTVIYYLEERLDVRKKVDNV